jgi:hypothetical protein
MSEGATQQFDHCNAAQHRYKFSKNIHKLTLQYIYNIVPAGQHPSSTWHIHRAILLDRDPDAQLGVVVIAPAFDPAPESD